MFSSNNLWDLGGGTTPNFGLPKPSITTNNNNILSPSNTQSAINNNNNNGIFPACTTAADLPQEEQSRPLPPTPPTFEDLWNILDEPKPHKGMNKSDLIYQLCLETFSRIKLVLENNLARHPEALKSHLIQPAVIPFKDGTAASSATSDPSKRIVRPQVNLEGFEEFEFFPNMKKDADMVLASTLALAMPAHPELLQNTVNKIATQFLHDRRRMGLDDSQEYSQEYSQPKTTEAENPSDSSFPPTEPKLVELINRTSKITMQFLKECFGDESMPRTSIFNNTQGNANSNHKEGPTGSATDAVVNTSQRRSTDASLNTATSSGNLMSATTANANALNANAIAASPSLVQSATSDNTLSNMSVPPPPPAGDPFDCNACRKPMTLQSFRIRCAECDDFDLCQACFCEGREVQNHKKEHYYIPIGPNQFSLFDDNWTADEELSLLDAIGKFGFGNWLDVSKTVNQDTPVTLPLKDKEACEKKYADFHLHGIDNCKENKQLWPLSCLLKKPPYDKWEVYLEAIDKYCTDDLVLSKKDAEKDAEKNAEKSADDNAAGSPTVITGVAKSPTEPGQKKPLMRLRHALITPIQTLPPRVQVLGYCGRRGDFEIEYENQAEFMIADMEFKDDESPMETEAKLRVVQAYNVILDERMNRKRLMLDKRIYDQKYQAAVDRLKTSEQKALYDLLKPIWKYIYVPWTESEPPLFAKTKKSKATEPLLTEAEIEELIDLIMEDKKLIERLDMLTAWHNSDLKTVQEVLEKGKSIVDQYHARKAKETKIASLKLLGSDTSASNNAKRHLTEEELTICRDINLREGLRHGFIEHLKKMLSKEVEESLVCNADGFKKVELAPDLIDSSIVLNDFSLNANIEALSAPSAVASWSGGGGSTRVETFHDDQSSVDGGENADSLVDGGSSSVAKAEPSSSDVAPTIPRKRKVDTSQVKEITNVDGRVVGPGSQSGSVVGGEGSSSDALGDEGGSVQLNSSVMASGQEQESPQTSHDEGELRITAYSSPNEEPAETEEGEIDDDEEAGYSEDGGNSSLVSNKYNSMKSDTSQYEDMVDGDSSVPNESFPSVGSNFTNGKSTMAAAAAAGLASGVTEKNDFSDCGISFENLND